MNCASAVGKYKKLVWLVTVLFKLHMKSLTANRKYLTNTRGQLTIAACHDAEQGVRAVGNNGTPPATSGGTSTDSCTCVTPLVASFRLWTTNKVVSRRADRWPSNPAEWCTLPYTYRLLISNSYSCAAGYICIALHYRLTSCKRHCSSDRLSHYLLYTTK